ncbi:MAG: acylphosphatase [Gemmataceae bacterium]|nr:acylphosphatase [Gemmataceae bacterium]
MICKHVHYSGRVQGVGFRYTARKIAAGFAVTGYVRNLRDGRVELVAEGEASVVDAFLDAVVEQMDGYIDQAAVTDAPAANYTGFEIRH